MDFPHILVVYFNSLQCVQYSSMVMLSDRLTASALVNFLLVSYKICDGCFLLLDYSGLDQEWDARRDSNQGLSYSSPAH
jgi:general stress protein CsbA